MALLHLPRTPAVWLGASSRDILKRSALAFLLSYLVLFLGMSLRPNTYDEGIELAAAIRVAAGQIPHRDFYTVYGPAQFYILAGLFKLFGTSLLVERLFDLLIKASVAGVVYAIAFVHCRRSLALGAGVVTVLWVFGLLNELFGYVATPVSLLNLVGTALVLPVIRGGVSKRRMLAVGAITGLTILFRYDTGLAFAIFEPFVVAVAVYLRFEGAAARVRAFGSIVWPFLAGLAAVTVPVAVGYFSVAPLRPLIHDALLYPAKHWVAGRRLPFPSITLKELDNIAVYSLPLIAGISVYLGAAHLYRNRHNGRQASGEGWPWSLLVFGCLAAGMYFKGWVRMCLINEYLSIIPCVLLLAILIENRSSFPRVPRLSILCLAGLFCSAATWSSVRQIVLLCARHNSLPESLVLSATRTMPETRAGWCKSANALTKGICFLPDDDRIQAIRFMVEHGSPGQTLFSGVTRHDKVFANDMMMYFATQRLPATKWSQFDPSLQNRYDVQTEMVREIGANAPQYVLRTSEFDEMNEPNTSSVRSGVTLLDEYLDKNYELTKTFGALSVWQRRRDGA